MCMTAYIASQGHHNSMNTNTALSVHVIVSVVLMHNQPQVVKLTWQAAGNSNFSKQYTHNNPTTFTPARKYMVYYALNQHRILPTDLLSSSNDNSACTTELCRQCQVMNNTPCFLSSDCCMMLSVSMLRPWNGNPAAYCLLHAFCSLLVLFSPAISNQWLNTSGSLPESDFDNCVSTMPPACSTRLLMLAPLSDSLASAPAAYTAVMSCKHGKSPCTDAVEAEVS